MSLSLFDAWLTARGHTRSTAKNYVHRVRAALRAAGVTKDVDIHRLEDASTLSEYVGGLTPQGRAITRAALVSFARFASEHGRSVQLPPRVRGQPDMSGTMPRDVEIAWRRMAKAANEEGFVSQHLVWGPYAQVSAWRHPAILAAVKAGVRPLPEMPPVLDRTIHGPCITGPSGSSFTFTEDALVGACSALYGWAMTQAKAEVPAPDAPVEPGAYLAWLATERHCGPVLPLPPGYTALPPVRYRDSRPQNEVPVKGQLPPQSEEPDPSPADWDTALGIPGPGSE